MRKFLSALMLLPQLTLALGNARYDDLSSGASGALLNTTVMVQAGISSDSTNSAVPCQIHAALYVGGAKGATCWPGGNGDIGAQINAAYAALPATGGMIYLLPQENGACYNFTTTIKFNVVNKFVILQGLAPSVGTNRNPSGACLLFQTFDSATPAIIIDWTHNLGRGTPLRKVRATLRWSTPNHSTHFSLGRSPWQ